VSPTPRSFALALTVLVPSAAAAQVSISWPQHSMDRPAPPVVTTDPTSGFVPPPSDAVILFNGSSLERWRRADSTGGPAPWKVQDGYFEVVPGTGAIATRDSFGDVQLHVEWAAPVPAVGTGQERGNSGVFLMGLYEVQVLDSYQNPTYPDGQAAALYGQYPPLVNASRPPGTWQSYDIIFHGPRFRASGELLRPARVTVFHNGVLVQDNVTLTGPTAHQRRPPYTAHPERLPLALQDHGNPVRYRNIWLRPLSDASP